MTTESKKARVLLPHNQASTFAEGYILNGIVTYKSLQKHRLIVVNSNTPRHFMLDAINREELLALDGA